MILPIKKIINYKKLKNQKIQNSPFSFPAPEEGGPGTGRTGTGRTETGRTGTGETGTGRTGRGPPSSGTGNENRLF